MTSMFDPCRLTGRLFYLLISAAARLRRGARSSATDDDYFGHCVSGRRLASRWHAFDNVAAVQYFRYKAVASER